MQPFLNDTQTVLMAGAGGGYDIFCGLPLYQWLTSRGKTVHLANLSFSPCISSPLQKVGPGICEEKYFPEKHLANFLQQPVYAILNDGPANVEQAYQALVNELKPDTLLLIDGGTDILMRGDEEDLGTPEEDISSLLAAYDSEISNKYLLCLGFGIDAFHGICHAHFLENVAALIQDGGYLGAWSLNQGTPEFDLLRDAYAYTANNQRSSIVNSSIIAAVEGKFGDAHATPRTEGSELFINPLMALYWAFQLDHVARRNLYLDQIRGIPSRIELSLKIEQFQALLSKSRPHRPIPC